MTAGTGVLRDATACVGRLVGLATFLRSTAISMWSMRTTMERTDLTVRDLPSELLRTILGSLPVVQVRKCAACARLEKE